MLLKSEFNFIEILVLDHQYPDSNDSDINWLNGEIKIEISGFKAHFKFNLYFEDLRDFYHQLLSLYDKSNQNARFIALEDDLILDFNSTTRGNILCEGIALCEGNSLKFKFEVEPYSIEQCLKSLELDLNRFPELKK